MASSDERMERGEKRKRSRNWEVNEIMHLVCAKKDEWERYDVSSFREKFESAVEKWNKVVEYLALQGIEDRDISQCKSKWDNLVSDFKEVKYWNRKGGHPSYFSMSRDDRRHNNLPLQFESKIFELMETFQGRKPSLAPSHVMDSSSMRQQSDESESREQFLIDREQCSSGKLRKKSSSGMLTAMAEMSVSVQSTMQEVEERRNTRYEQMLLLERERLALDREYRNRSMAMERERMAVEREDRNKLIGVLGTLAKTFEKMSEKM
eukprot:Gb_20121 [translate_table: standard]